jgi:SAM-dependent methyltransferase
MRRRSLTFIRSQRGKGYDDAFMAEMTNAYAEQTRWTRMRLRNVQELVDPGPGDRVLDVGCATGAMCDFLASFGCEVVGLDPSEIGIAEARRLHPELEFVLADAVDMPFEDGSFDKALLADVTEHMEPEPLRGAFAECFRVLGPGGTLSIHTPNPRHLVERLKARGLLVSPNETHTGLRVGEELGDELRRAGFEVELDLRRPGFVPVLRELEAIGSRFTELLGYRICIRARKPR